MLNLLKGSKNRLHKHVTLSLILLISLAEMAVKSRIQFAKALGKRIRAIRVSKGISLKHFEAKENSIHRHSLSDIEKGKKIPNIYTAYRIAKILEVELEELFTDL